MFSAMGGLKNKLIQGQDAQQAVPRLHDMPSLSAVHLLCNRCRHTAILERDYLLKWLPLSTSVGDVGAHCRCLGCGSKDVAARMATREEQVVIAVF